ncbi:negative transcriptional regulator, PaiB family [Pseudomonas pohangensis]|uniref:Negative transcriptional regulator, PaiB family n=1 Tax=Pseudomonas pohangensis TaxID=364197 RepID=A0A1H2F3S1_9PSED|nr:FMN-binding negative transcriptional regulator [Pseudomonas pohangensis]SDU02020.1 negative transcriptional regulator, PaiB family [Pseudomonas pohangensis]
MYVPAHFAEHRPEQLQQLIRQYPLGVLITHGDEGLDANHLPFELLADQGPCGTLIGHVARANPLWREASEGLDVLVVFRAEEAYLSPNWYPSKHEQHRQVPTWNYRVVHAHGRLRVRDDEQFVRGVVARLTRTHEARAGAEKPWKITDSSPEFIAQMLAAIVGIEIELTRLEGKFKLSQNKDARDIEGAAQGLQARGKLQLAEQMRAARPE